jgi:hypothetical protein
MSNGFYETIRIKVTFLSCRRKRFSSECYNVDTTLSIVDSFKIDFVYAVDALSSSCFQDLEIFGFLLFLF